MVKTLKIKHVTQSFTEEGTEFHRVNLLIIKALCNSVSKLCETLCYHNRLII